MLPDDDQDAMAGAPRAQRFLLDSRLRYHLRCLREDARSPEITPLEWLALVRDRAARIREIRRELERIGVADSIGLASVGANRIPSWRQPGRDQVGEGLVIRAKSFRGTVVGYYRGPRLQPRPHYEKERRLETKSLGVLLPTAATARTNSNSFTDWYWVCPPITGSPSPDDKCGDTVSMPSAMAW